MKDPAAAHPRPAPWITLLALALVYLSWGTTYLAIREGVRTLPPGLFGGTRVALAGLVLLIWLLLRGQSVRLSGREFAWTWGVGSLLFVGGNGLITLAEKTVASGVASVLAATTPLWLALLETLWPRGERLTVAGWLGLLLGLVGVGVLWVGRPAGAHDAAGTWGPFLVLGSALLWSTGSSLHRHRRSPTPHLVGAAYQMLLGGGTLALLGLVCGEARGLEPEQFTPRAVFAFGYLLVVGSLVGFIAYTWLLQNVSAALAGTYAYVNPAIALLVGWLLAGEALTAPILGGMAVILAGVGLVRTAGALHRGRGRQTVVSGGRSGPAAAEPPVTSSRSLRPPLAARGRG